MIVTKSFTFEAAHSLPHLPVTHKCHRLHGHSYGFTVAVDGQINAETGFVTDYADIALAVRNRVLRVVDHQNLDDILPGITSAENLAIWIAERLNPVLSGLAWVEVRETPTTSVIYRLEP